MIVERTHYYAKPGRVEATLATRRKACVVRVRIGLPAGAIRTKADPTADGPDVSWELEFPTEEAHRADLAARAASPAFETVRAEMRSNIARFERLFEKHETVLNGWSGDVAVETITFVPAALDFPSQGRTLKGYLWTPPGPGPFPCVVYNHGSGLKEPFEDAALPGIPVLLASWGIACFFPHRHGYGLSPGPHWRSEVPDEPFSEAYNRKIVARLERESEDVRAALSYVRGLSSIDPNRLALMGSSFGGVMTLLAAAAEPELKCAVEFAGAAMNWDRNPLIAARMLEAARALQIGRAHV